MTVIHLYKTSVPVSRSFSHPTSWILTSPSGSYWTGGLFYAVFYHCSSYISIINSSWKKNILLLENCRNITIKLVQFVWTLSLAKHCGTAMSSTENISTSFLRSNRNKLVQYTMLEIVEMGFQFCSCSSRLESFAPHHLPPWEKPAFHTLSQRHQNCEIYKYLKEETSSHVKEVTYLRQKEKDLKKIKVMYLL